MVAMIFLGTPLLTIIPISGGSESEEMETRAAGNTPMGDWSELPSGGWPSMIDSGDCNVFYREETEELVVINQESSEFEVWSMYASNHTWVKWRTSGQGPSLSHSAQSFISNWNNSIGFYYGGWSYGGYWDKMNAFFYENRTWLQIEPHPDLDARYWSGMVYDNATDSVWIFGGRGGGNPSRRDDLYQYNFTHGWTKHPEITQSGETRDQPLMTITPDGQDIYIGLGRYSSGGGGTTYLKDLWHYNVSGQTWTEINDALNVITDTGAILHYREVEDDLILTMGFDGNTRLNNTYILNRTDGSVRQVQIDSSIPGRHIQAWDLMKDGRTAVIFGDDDGRRDLWSLDLVDYNATLMPGNPPWSGGTAFTGYDPEDGGKLMALKYQGGSFWQLAYYSLESKRWNMMSVSTDNTPTYHDGMANVYDPIDNVFYLYGGYYTYQVSQWVWHFYFYDEFWKLDCDTGNWTRINEHALPGERGRASLVLDEENRFLYLFGGQIDGGDTNSHFQYNITGNIWKTVNTQTTPNPRMEHSVAFQPNHPTMKGYYLFGGQRNGSTSTELDDLWFYHTDSGLWEKLQDGDDKPSMQDWAGISVNTDTHELMLYGDQDAETFFWRLEWNGWRKIITPHSPGDWSGHGQAYSPEYKSHLAWAYDGTQVWEFNPILRTPAIQIQLYDPFGNTSGTSPVEAFPTIGTYELKVRGRTDMPESDLLGIKIRMDIGDEILNLTWDRATKELTIDGYDEWVVFPGGERLIFPDEKNWEFYLPMQFTFNMTHGETVDAVADPITAIAYTETARRLNLISFVSELEVVGYQFWTEHQENPPLGDYLFGGTNLNIRYLDVSFKDKPDRYPASGHFLITLEDGFGNMDEWVYETGTMGNLSIPILGDDNQWVKFYLNLTTTSYEVMDSIEFTFRIDLYPPGIVQGATLRADGFDDETVLIDNDPNMYFTWDSVVETGSGLKGVCYSIGANMWPGEENLTTDFEQLNLGQEGSHTMYVWAIDNMDRVGPFVELPVIVDSHQVFFTDPNPPVQANVTYRSFVASITINDTLSGVDLNSIYYRYSLPSKQFSDWINYEINGTNENSIRVSVTLDLVPGMVNLVQFKARDVAMNDEKESVIMKIHYDPDLIVPRAELEGPADGYEAITKADLAWEGDYINPENLTYQVHVALPNGSETVIPVDGVEYEYIPKIPGDYEWWIVSIADGKSNASEHRLFSYQPDFIDVTFPSTAEVTIGYDLPLEVSFENTLEVDVEITITLDVSRDFVITDGDTYQMSPGENVSGYLILNSSAAQKGGYKINIKVTDSYGREKIISVQLMVNEEIIDIPDDDTTDEGLPIPLIVGIAAGILLLIIIIILVLARRKGTDEEEEEEEDDLDKPISLDYDPTGKVADGGTKVKSAVPLAPGIMADDEEAARKRGKSHIIEHEIPSKDDEEEEIESGPEWDEAEEYEEAEEEDEMEELTPEEMAAELYGDSNEE